MPDSLLPTILTFLLAVLVVVLAVILVQQRSEIDRLRRQLQAARRDLGGDAGVTGLGVLDGPGTNRGLDPRITPTMIAMVQQGRKIQAIKLFRETTGVGLAEAKDAIDEIP